MPICPSSTEAGCPSEKLCECGCGSPAPIAQRTTNRAGHTKGQPIRFVRGHAARVMQPSIALPGERYGSLIVIGEAPGRVYASGARVRRVFCRCDCGTEIITDAPALSKGHTKSCGCSRTTTTVGTRFGRLVVEERIGNKARCRCDCGNETIVLAGNLAKGDTTSCGCRVKIHGHATDRDGRTPTYITWMSMRTRCGNPNHRDYQHYGGRGISVCTAWQHSFEAFLADMGERPSGTTIDRIDPDGNYEPDNCRWADAITQRRNRRT